MERKSSIRSLLGVTQHEMASLLHISRSQWSMYELGKGNLPSAATLLLADLLTHVKASEKIEERRSQLTQQKGLKQKLLILLRENEYQQVLTAKKITFAKKKHAAQIKMIPLVGLLEEQPISQSSVATELLKILSSKTSKSMATEAAVVLFELQVKQQMLAFEKELFELKLREIDAV